jgi:hypothetical protein
MGNQQTTTRVEEISEKKHKKRTRIYKKSEQIRAKSERIRLDRIEKSENPLLAGLKSPLKVIITGRQNTGKTNLLFHIIRWGALNQWWDEIYIMCPTIDHQFAYEGVFDPSMILEGSEESLNIFYERQKKYVSTRTLLILDDVIGTSIKLRNSKVLDGIAGASRHYQLSFIILVQALNVLPPIMRQNADFLFITKITDRSVPYAWHYSDGFKTEREFREFLEKARVGFDIVRITGDSASSITMKPEEKITIFDPGLCPKFSLIS